MAADGYKYLHFANYKDILNWSVQYVDENDIGFTKKYPTARIGSFLSKSNDVIEVQDDVEYRQITLKINNGGLVPRNDGATLKGASIGTKRQTVIHSGQFIMSKIDARNGAYGIVPDNLDGAIVTNDFPVFNVDQKKIIPLFLVLISTTAHFIEFARKCSTGTTNRKRIDINAFLRQSIPLPSIEEQKDIINHYNDIQSSINQIQLKIESLTESRVKLIKDTLGVQKNENCHKKDLLSFIYYHETNSRWDASRIVYPISSIYKIDRLGNYIKLISTGTTPPTGNPAYFIGDIPFYTPGDLGGTLHLTHSKRTISEIAVADKKARLFHRGDILFVGIGSTIGKVGIVNNERASSNQQITGLTIDSDKINPEYVLYFLECNKDITAADFSKTTLPIINQEKIANIPIVVPSKEVQNHIIISMRNISEQISHYEDTIKSLNLQSSEYINQQLFES